MRHSLSPKYWLACLTVTAVSALTPQAASANCNIPPDWISDGVPDPLILAENSKFGSFCDFHTWSWNAFLWSMEDIKGVLRFETFPTQQQTIDGSFQVNAKANSNMLKLQLRAVKKDHPIDSIAQAGTLGLLVAQNKRGVYYSQHINPQMYKQIIDDNWNNAQGLISESPTALFDVGNIEFKAAWAIVDDTFSVPGAHTRKAMIPQIATVQVNGVPTITVPPNPTYVEAEVALIGLHVVGWVNEHSEAIWASFSPIKIAPVVPTDSKGNPTIKPDDPVSADGTPFYTANTTLANCNQIQVPIQKLNDATQEFAVVSQSCQVYESGTIGGISTSNGQAIDQINTSAASSLPKTWPAATYDEIGAVWSNSDSQTPDKLNSTFQDALVGSNVLSNPVIETFTQTDVAQHNCFSCHNSLQFQPSDPKIPPLHASMLNLSHFLMQIYVDTFK